jgi:endonuclease/exonuclease/phosphatase family metal-dependent hydrolase
MTTFIFNLNCWLFGKPLSSDCYGRMDKIVAMIKEKNPEIITLQEVWSNRYISYLEEKLPNYTFIFSKTPFWNQSGLVTILKQAPLNYKVNFFKLSRHHNFTEFFLRKGYITTEVMLEDEKWYLINTHLYAAFSGKGAKITEEEFTELVSKLPSTNVLLCGDFNFEEQKFNELNSGRFSRMCNSEITFGGDGNPYARARFNALMKKNKKIDYLLYKSPSILNTEYEVIKSPFVSDHYPMYAKITS